MEHNHKPAKEQFYDNSVKTLEWNEHIQRRPEMYIGQLGHGSDPKDGIYTLLKGVLVMAMDEFQMGFGKGFSIEVKNDYAVVRDYGRGIPLQTATTLGWTGLTYSQSFISTNPSGRGVPSVYEMIRLMVSSRAAIFV